MDHGGVAHESLEVTAAVLSQWPAAVTYRQAAEFMSLSERWIRKLVAEGKLERVGEGQWKRVTTASIRRYCGLP